MFEVDFFLGLFGGNHRGIYHFKNAKKMLVAIFEKFGHFGPRLFGSRTYLLIYLPSIVCMISLHEIMRYLFIESCEGVIDKIYSSYLGP